jgi:hypothetical protein
MGATQRQIKRATILMKVMPPVRCGSRLVNLLAGLAFSLASTNAQAPCIVQLACHQTTGFANLLHWSFVICHWSLVTGHLSLASTRSKQMTNDQ